MNALERWRRELAGWDDAIAFIRRRLCLPADRDGELAEALGGRLVERDGLWSAGPLEHRIVTMWWDRRAT